MTCTNRDTNRKLDAWVWRLIRDPVGELDLGITYIKITLEDIEKIPASRFIQITGGEPFMRTDLEDIVGILSRKTKRLMINTNGFFTDRIVDLCKKYPSLAIRISVDGRKEVHGHQPSFSKRRDSGYPQAQGGRHHVRIPGGLEMDFQLYEYDLTKHNAPAALD